MSGVQEQTNSSNVMRAGARAVIAEAPRAHSCPRLTRREREGSCGDALLEKVDRRADRGALADLRLERRLGRAAVDHIDSESLSQSTREERLHLVERDPYAEALERRGLMREPARDHALEPGEIGRDVEREPVGRDAAAHAHADRAELRGWAGRERHPYAGALRDPPRSDAKLRRDRDDGLLD